MLVDPKKKNIRLVDLNQKKCDHPCYIVYHSDIYICVMPVCVLRTKGRRRNANVNLVQNNRIQ